MSLADSLLADLDGLSDGEDAPSPPQASASKSASSGPGQMLPPPLPLKAKRLADDLDASTSASSSSKRVKFEKTNGGGDGEVDGDEDDGDDDVDMNGEGGVKMGFVPEGGVRPADELDEEVVNQTDLTDIEDIGEVAKLIHSKKLKEILADISRYTAAPSDMSSSSGPLEENPEYSLVVSANNMSVEVDNEILIVHKFIRDHYAPRFPELEQLIADPWTYIAAVKAIANTEDLTRCTLPNTLPPATILSINLTATVTKGRQLTEGEWRTVERAIEFAQNLRIAREQIFAYVESRMSSVAPNLSAIVGTGIAAKLLGLAGGLQAFSRQPACNIMLFGAQKRTLANSHLSAASQARHTGFIFSSPIVQSAQPEDRRRAQRAVSAKCILAARIDAGKSARDGSAGRKWLGELQKRIEKMAEPPPNKMTKALPIPQETIRKKRGGKRARKQKEAYAQTELRKLQNRMEFGKAEEEFGMDDETVGLGMVGQGSGRVRGEQVDARSKAKLSRANRIRTQMLGRSLTSQDAKSGTSTSLSFTPVQGLEIVTPSLSAAARVQQANERWFASGTFTHVRKEGSSIPGQVSK